MKIYNCDNCGQIVYFENSLCLSCGFQLGYLPTLDNMSSIQDLGEGQWKALAPSAEEKIYKKCKNYHLENVCNWMIPIEEDDEYCLSCKFNHIIPNLSIPENRKYWQRLEIAKRRLIYSLLRLHLPLNNKKTDPERGLSFDFLSNEKGLKYRESKRVLTGHNQGKITFNIEEANDAVREKMRLDMNERYRTLLGHFRHEIGHYYWFLLISNNNNLLTQFREEFGDERINYNFALKQYYINGPVGNWQERFISAYASSHPWEDFAECWAHYLHMFDTLETAISWGFTKKVESEDGMEDFKFKNHDTTFDEMKDQWLYVSTALNSMNRSMG
ncbi:MAG: putative zinc-binding metallopeptidase, partial [Leptospiraceae bacterium]|nr:putative zinc-binding metallopeptidase [Leptospiraceae bacterium]